MTDSSESTELAVFPTFQNETTWKLAQRIATAFASSTLVPTAYQNNVANCVIALEMANRLGTSALLVMQNLDVIHGRPGWSAKFLIATLNQCGRFTTLRYVKDETSCRAWAIEKATQERLEGPKVTMKMAADEGWLSKTGSKWKTMPELMLMYRSAAFFVRVYAPELSMGLPTVDELEDIAPERSMSLGAVRAALDQAPAPDDGVVQPPAAAAPGFGDVLDIEAADADPAPT